jgi:hypothetical protein
MVCGLPGAELVTGTDSAALTVAFVGMKVIVIVQLAPGTSVLHMVDG